MKAVCSSTQDLLAQKETFTQYARMSPSRLSAQSFVPLFVWQDFFDYRFEVLDGNLCVFAGQELGEFLMLPPLPQEGAGISSEAVDECFRRMKDVNGPGGVSRIDNVSAEGLEDFDQERFAFYVKTGEYCYHRQDIENLRGNAYKSQRGDVNRFRKNSDYAYRPYDPSMAEDCRALYDRWALQAREGKDDVFCQMIDENRVVLRRVLEGFGDLELVGRAVEVAGEIKAFTFGYTLTDDTFCVLMETADREVSGLSSFIFREFCADPALRKFSLVNVMDDWGAENLGAVKRAYHPAMLLPVYTVTEKSALDGLFSPGAGAALGKLHPSF